MALKDREAVACDKRAMEPLGRICHHCGKLLPNRPKGVFTSLLTECSICGQTAYCGNAHNYGFPSQSERDAIALIRLANGADCLAFAARE